MSTSANQTSSDSPVAVRVIFNGKDENRKFKLALKDLPATVLPDKLRDLLGIASSQEVLFERFSDSSASFITLESNNPSVYKQLYRAAKAKGKLRLRVTVREKATLEPEVVQQPGLPDRLQSRCYVHPYISEPTNADLGPSSRISTLADMKTLAAAPSSLSLAPTISAAKSFEAETSSDPHQRSHPLFWPVSDDGDFSKATKSVFEKKTLALRGAKEGMVEGSNTDEAPIPQVFTARDHCLAEITNLRNKYSARRAADKTSAPCTNFTICCNNCDKAIPDSHWHCGICDDGDFDLCQICIDRGVLCDDNEHWMIKRFVKDGQMINSTTTMAPKDTGKVEDKKDVPGAFTSDARNETVDSVDLSRTCNSCVQVFDESNFVTCKVCEDYDLCIPCHVGMKHGHHPAHAFKLASKETTLDAFASSILRPGRNARHWAICDGCDKDIYGIRHKCLKCPDWDYCSECVKLAGKNHPGHRMVALFEPLITASSSKLKHEGICCDGPLCEGKSSCIRGDRYKCAVCHDTDFCSNCEALPKLQHNRTHPLLKFQTPVRNVSVSTLGEKPNGEPMPTMGDQIPQTSSKSTETTPLASSANAATQVRTVAEVKPVKSPASGKANHGSLKADDAKTAELTAHFVRDTITDGSLMFPATQFIQTWTLRNAGPATWPVGCSVCFVGGDGMLDVDPNHPSHITQIRKAIRSNTIERTVNVGEEVDFEVTMRAPEREGKAISYWRLKSADGLPFGHKLWCDIDVRKNTKPSQDTRPKPEEQIKPDHTEDVLALQPKVEDEDTDANEVEQPRQSQMIFPKLDKESPGASTHEADIAVVPAAPVSTAEKDSLEDIESLELDDESSDEGFLTDEEYELIASSDEMVEAKNGKK